MSAIIDSLTTAPDQSDLSLNLAPNVLARIPWRRKLNNEGQPIGEHPGVEELAGQRGLDTTALLNDLQRAGLMADARLNAVAFEELLRDEHRPTRGIRMVKDDKGTPIGIEIQGPSAQEWLPNNNIGPHIRPGTHWWQFLVTGWVEVPAFVAHWFWWAQREDARLGAAYGRQKLRHERESDEGRNAVVNTPSVYQRLALRHEASEEEAPAPAMLFEFRMACERAPGERPSGLVVPGASANDTELAALRAQLAELQKQLANQAPRAQKGQ